MLLPLKKIISMCVCERERENKEKQEGFFLNRETYIRIIVIDLIIVKLFGVYPVVFPFKKKGFFHINFVFLCVIVILDC